MIDDNTTIGVYFSSGPVSSFCPGSRILPGDTAYVECNDSEIGRGIRSKVIRPYRTACLSHSDWRTSLYYHFYEYPAEHAVKRHYGVRTDRYKLIHFYNDIDVWELYDLQNDPMEMHNIFGQEGTEQVTADLMKELKRLQVQYDDPVLKEFPIGE